MKIRVDINTKDADKAAAAFVRIDKEASPKSLSLSLNTWGDEHYNIDFEVDSKYTPMLEELFNNEYFNEDVDKL
jgi:hypothetical protein